MTLYDLKPAFQNLLRPLVGRLAAAGITPNQVTAAACIASIAYGLALFFVDTPLLWLGLPVFLLLRMMLNAIDGMLAREHNMTSRAGVVLNETGDLISDAALYLAFIGIATLNDFSVVLFVLFAWLGEVVAILGYSLCQQRINSGPLGKSDRAFVMSAIALLFAVAPDLLNSIVNFLFIALNILAALTLINRSQKVIKFHG
ncbi:CDP-alcohol phosphatidyltransferase family protein [Marinobacterium lutimaris]|uniref:CDP-diacylglycerol--glycerol-3-phosphate 3-phosphatidyltransferase n=1 Tax=Marinobacterium lutimaris TaxID=568106 RepID=A0A1H6BDX6_9GAMM|nr:CDP-alcohol phosphatidyltransferase family protein [Marinobacterium lutimaris]SEG58437.1 CDP-diacylglycerol--glycerol-3-phosphate 3-phosphatidyltransferase [Marinobacterium lutimaris]